MSMEYLVYVGFTDGASRHTQNLALATWVIYTPMGQMFSSGGVFFRPLSNNIFEYSSMIDILGNSISHCI